MKTKPKNWSSLYTPEINKKRSDTLKQYKKGGINIGLGHKKGQKLTIEHKKRIGEGIKKSEKHKKAMSDPERSRKLSKALREKPQPWHAGEKSHLWKGGISFTPYPIDWTKTLKRAIRERDHYTCQFCGKEPAIICHHIDYDKKNCNPENLITLCRSCHIKTNQNRKHWIEYFMNRVVDSRFS